MQTEYLAHVAAGFLPNDITNIGPLTPHQAARAREVAECAECACNALLVMLGKLLNQDESTWLTTLRNDADDMRQIMLDYHAAASQPCRK